MSMNRRDPWNIFDQLQNDINRAFDVRGGSGDASIGATSDWSPVVDIVEYPDKFVLLADIPGVSVGDVDLSLENSVLSLQGIRQAVATGDDGTLKRAERARGSFFRRFVLPDTASADEVTATGKDGVVEIVIPKAQPAKPKKITVRAD